MVALYSATRLRGIALHDDEKPRLVCDLGKSNFFAMHNHDLLTADASIADAFLFMFALQRACEIQVQAGGELVEVDPRILRG